MATEVASAYVTLIPSARGFQSKLRREIESPAGVEGDRAGRVAGDRFSNSFSQRIGQQSRRMFGVLAKGALYGGLAIAAAGTAAVGFGLKTAAALEQAKVGFTTMLGSATKASKFLAKLRDFANKTPFEFPDVVRASQRLLAMGFASRKVLPTLTAIGDTAAGLGIGAQGIDQITTAIGQMQAKGKVQSDELLQLTEAGVPALKILAAGFGTTTAKMQEMVTKGMVPSNKAIPLLIRGLEKGTKTTSKFGGLMARQAKTLGGLWSTFKDTVSTGLATAVQPLVPILERLLPHAMDGLQVGFRYVARGGRDFIKVLEGGRGSTKGFLGSVTAVATFLRDRFVPAVVAIWRQAAPALGSFITNAAKLGRTLWPAIKPVLQIAGAAVIGGMRAASKLMGFLADHATVAKDALVVIAGLWAGKKLSGALGALTGKGALGRGGGGLLGGLLGSAKPVPVFVTNMGAGLGGGLPGGKEKAGPLGTKVGSALATVASALGLANIISNQAKLPKGISTRDRLLNGAGAAMIFGTQSGELRGTNTVIPSGRRFPDAASAKGAKVTGIAGIQYVNTEVRTAGQNFRVLNKLLVAHLGIERHRMNPARRAFRDKLISAQTTKHMRLDGSLVGPENRQILAKIAAAQLDKHMRLDAQTLTRPPAPQPIAKAPWIGQFLTAARTPSVYVRGNLVVQGTDPKHIIDSVNRRSRLSALGSGSGPYIPHGL